MIIYLCDTALLNIRVLSSCTDSFEQASLVKARTCFRKFLEMMKTKTDDAFMTYLAHSLIHVCDDAEAFQSHLGALSAYFFENFLMEFSKVSNLMGRGSCKMH